jgi:hypothetical protein
MVPGWFVSLAYLPSWIFLIYGCIVLFSRTLSESLLLLIPLFITGMLLLGNTMLLALGIREHHILGMTKQTILDTVQAILDDRGVSYQETHPSDLRKIFSVPGQSVELELEQSDSKIRIRDNPWPIRRISVCLDFGKACIIPT